MPVEHRCLDSLNGKGGHLFYPIESQIYREKIWWAATGDRTSDPRDVNAVL